jgi:hypothetical protein
MSGLVDLNLKMVWPSAKLALGVSPDTYGYATHVLGMNPSHYLDKVSNIGLAVKRWDAEEYVLLKLKKAPLSGANAGAVYLSIADNNDWWGLVKPNSHMHGVLYVSLTKRVPAYFRRPVKLALQQLCNHPIPTLQETAEMSARCPVCKVTVPYLHPHCADKVEKDA